MSNEIRPTIVGNLTADPELRFAPGGDAVANFTVASTERTFSRAANDWQDQETVFMRCAAWRDLAENVAESLTKGTRVFVTGVLKARSYETREGERRTSLEVQVEDVGPSLRYATASVKRTARGSANIGGAGGFNTDPRGGGYAQTPPANPAGRDPWAATAPGAGFRAEPEPEEPAF